MRNEHVLNEVCCDFDALSDPKQPNHSIKMCEFTGVVHCGILTIFFFFN